MKWLRDKTTAAMGSDEPMTRTAWRRMSLLMYAVWDLRPVNTAIVGKLSLKELLPVVEGARRAHWDVRQKLKGDTPPRHVLYFYDFEVRAPVRAELYHTNKKTASILFTVMHGKWETTVRAAVLNGWTFDLVCVGHGLSPKAVDERLDLLAPLMGANTRIVCLAGGNALTALSERYTGARVGNFTLFERGHRRD